MNPQAKHPIKLALAAIFLDDRPRSAQEAFTLLQPLYGKEKICTLAGIEKYLMSLKAIGVITAVRVDDAGGEMRWGLTRSGRERVLKGL